ncbi:MAG TPA: polysaccharide biosynthesis/export family protein [Acidobacteriaceae bacterium]|nr:polysaccharide biosynthesis/export family protein [Acidobacteriaceae bacterium]
MIPLFDKSTRTGCFRLTCDCTPSILKALSSGRLRATLCNGLVLGLVVFVLATAAFAQSEPSVQSPSSSSPGQENGPAASVSLPTEAPPEYRVGPGDVLEITVYNMVELDQTAVVGSDGALQLSYLPQTLNIEGEKAQQIEEQVAIELKRLQILLDPQVSVAVIKVESKPVVVGGDVRTPQVLEEIRPFTLQEVLMLSGGPQGDSGNSVVVTRANPNGGVVSYDLQLSKVMAGTDPGSNIQIKPGDSIQVLSGQRVFVAGAVKSPGAFDLKGDQRLTIANLMALTGGWQPDSDPTKAVIVRQNPGGQRQVIPVNLRKIMDRKEHDVALEANDLLYVPGDRGKTVGLAVVKGVGTAALWATGYLIVR